MSLDSLRDSVAGAQGSAKERVALVDSRVLAGDGQRAAAALGALRTEYPSMTPIAELVLRNYARRLFQSDRAGSMDLRRLATEMYPTSFSAHNELGRSYLCA